MSYKNTMKLFVSNFALAWKQLVYLLICTILFVLCSYTLVSPVVSVLQNAGVGEEIKNLVQTIYNNPKDIAITFSQIVSLIFNSLVANFSKIYINLIVAVILCLFLPYILIQMSLFNVSSILHQKLTMNMDVGYCQNYVKNFTKSLKFSLANVIFSLPFWVVNVGLIYSYLLFSRTVFMAIIGLSVLSMIMLILNGIKLTLFSHYTGSVVAENIGMFHAFTRSLKFEIKNFWKILGGSIVIILTAILINGVIAIFTFFAGVIFTLPATFVLFCIYKVVTYLTISGNRYYLSSTLIYNPQGYEVKKDDYVSADIPQEEIKEITTTKMKKRFKTKKEKKNKKKSKTNKNIEG